MNIEERLVQVYVSALNIDAKRVVDELEYNSIAEWDSTAHMMLIAELEAEFQVMFETDEIIDMSNVAICKALLRKHGVKFD
ncbi:acyl carrier protein [Shewanella waksmanii]|uniref:acyl carrier protein n=1 Tax=Shewanella waksmanii TaxID=213783 RepID=UPI003736261E